MENISVQLFIKFRCKNSLSWNPSIIKNFTQDVVYTGFSRQKNKICENIMAFLELLFVCHHDRSKYLSIINYFLDMWKIKQKTERNPLTKIDPVGR